MHFLIFDFVTPPPPLPDKFSTGAHETVLYIYIYIGVLVDNIFVHMCVFTHESTAPYIIIYTCV